MKNPATTDSEGDAQVEIPPRSLESLASSPASPTRRTVGVWTLHEYGICASTNLIAANLPAWSAVRSDEQSAGRGRFQRGWISDRGGLWLSAVVPTQVNSPGWRFLPLTVGVTVCEVLAGLGIKTRLRWPNDVLVGRQKLAGILIDQFTPGLAVAGIGLNVSNQPEARDASLRGLTTSLSGLLPTPPNLSELTRLVLEKLHQNCGVLQKAGPQALLPQLNPLWGEPRPVKLDLDGREVRGRFAGVDAEGRLAVRSASNAIDFFEPHQVRLLRELD